MHHGEFFSPVTHHLKRSKYMANVIFSRTLPIQLQKCIGKYSKHLPLKMTVIGQKKVVTRMGGREFGLYSGGSWIDNLGQLPPSGSRRAQKIRERSAHSVGFFGPLKTTLSYLRSPVFISFPYNTIGSFPRLSCQRSWIRIEMTSVPPLPCFNIQANLCHSFTPANSLLYCSNFVCKRNNTALLHITVFSSDLKWHQTLTTLIVSALRDDILSDLS